ncbi:unnamed protein product [Phytophthora fragariaefolia]|uniref:Unnamed protein product n=1 Tax=Phytophthora fragariaefolia TaxID=1490495 RepID=A0A9W7CQZ9_9STRA|nr:unnamed protein product [Phytophthora fragariaefolia]
MVQEVAQLLAKSWLKRRFSLRACVTGRCDFVEMSTVIGNLAGKRKLSDAVMHCALQYSFSHQVKLSYAVDPLHVESSTFVFPATTLPKYAYIVVPVYLRSLKHWFIQIVSLPPIEDALVDGQTVQNFKLVLYDPLGIDGHINALRAVWKRNYASIAS